jgi:RNA-binding protein Nova
MAHDLDSSDSESYRRGEKRSLDSETGSAISIASKRPNIGPDDEAFVKFLVPSVVPGMIIGSAGTTIAELMDATRTSIKFSRGQETYPGTGERVCCISGPIANICDAVREVFAKMSDPGHSRYDDLQSSLGKFRMLVSNIAAGMVIGKSGQTIKSLQEESDVKIQISKKDDTAALPERILTITAASTEAVLRALGPILELTRNDPDLQKWRKLLSYSNYPAPSSRRIPSPATSTVLNNSLAGVSGAGGMGSAGMFNAHAMSNLQSAVMAGAGGGDYSSPTSFLSMFQHPAYASAFANNSMAQQMAQAAAQQNSAGSSFNTALLSYSYAQSLMSNSSYLGHMNPVMVDGVNLMVPGATLCTYEIAVPEIMIGSVIGHGAKLLTDLMQATSTRITLSGKGEYIPGTYNRKLTIIGPILSVQAAQMVVVQKVMKEQEVYRKQGLV